MAERNCWQKRGIGSLLPVFVNDGFTWMGCCTKACHNMNKSGIYKITNGDMVQKWHEFFKLAPAPLFFLLLLLLMVAYFDSNNVGNNYGEKKTFILLLPRDNNDKEDEGGNNEICCIFFQHHLRTRSFSSRHRHPAIDRSTMVSTSASTLTYAITPSPIVH